MARLIILRGHDSDLIRMDGTEMEVQFPDDNLDFITDQARRSIDFASRLFVAKRVSQVRAHTPPPGSNAAKVVGCSCQGPSNGSSLQRYILDKKCMVHRGKWPSL